MMMFMMQLSMMNTMRSMMQNRMKLKYRGNPFPRKVSYFVFSLKGMGSLSMYLKQQGQIS